MSSKRDRLPSSKYVGTLENGTVFDSTRVRGKPYKIAIGMGQLIKGWEEGIPGMRVGETRKLWVPWKQGYGDVDKDKIPARSNLNFEIELVKIDNQ